jgi:hypothetical protein
MNLARHSNGGRKVQEGLYLGPQLISRDREWILESFASVFIIYVDIS